MKRVIFIAAIAAVMGFVLPAKAESPIGFGAVPVYEDTTKTKGPNQIETLEHAFMEIEMELIRLRAALETTEVQGNEQLKNDIERSIEGLEHAKEDVKKVMEDMRAKGIDSTDNGNRVVIGNDGLNIRWSGDKDNKDKPLPNLKTEWFQFALGVNALTDNGSFNMTPANYAFEQDHIWSVNALLGLITQGVNIYKHNVYVTYGLALSFNDYRLRNDVTFAPRTDSLLIIDEAIDFKKNKLSAHYLQVPVMLHFETNPRNPGRSFELGVGAYGNMLFQSYQKQVSSERGKQKVRDDFGLNQFNYGVMAQIGYSNLKFYTAYALTPLFEPKKGPGLQPMTFGIILEGFNWN